MKRLYACVIAVLISSLLMLPVWSAEVRKVTRQDIEWTTGARPSTDCTVTSAGGHVGNVLDNTYYLDSPYVDVRAYDTFALALTAAANKTLLVASTVTISDNTTIPDNVAVLVLRGGTFAIDNGVVLTINGLFDAGLYQVFSGSGTVAFGTGSVDGVRPEWYGAKADDLDASAVANTAAINKAALTTGGDVVTLLLSSGTYKVTAASGSYAIETHANVIGISPASSIIKNIGAGSAMVLSRSGAGLYNSGKNLLFQNFSVVGNASSEDGITTSIQYAAGNELASYRMVNVDSNNHGRHGLVHRQAWAAEYTNCRFDYNGGLGVYAYAVSTDYGVGSGDGANRLVGSVNQVNFVGCSATHNGGTGDATGDYLYGGVRFATGTGISWVGGDIEWNNAWGIIVSATSGAGAFKTQGVTIQNVWCEAAPPSTASSTIGGCIIADGAWEVLNIRDNYIAYGGAAGQTGYGIYVKGDANNAKTRLVDEGNIFVVANPAGTEYAKHIEGIYPGKEIATTKITSMNIVDGTDAAHINVEMVNLWNGDVVAAVDNIGKDAVDTGGYKLDATGSQLTILESNMTLTLIHILSVQLALNSTGVPISVYPNKVGAGIMLDFRNPTTDAALDLTTLVDTGPITLRMTYIAGQHSGNYEPDL